MTGAEPSNFGPPPREPPLFRTELLISRLLRVGVLASLALITLGTALSFAQNVAYRAERGAVDRLVHGGEAPNTLARLAVLVFELDGQGLIMLGVLLLIITPVLRVFVSIAAFARQRDRAFVVITTIVLLLLALGFYLGKVD